MTMVDSSGWIEYFTGGPLADEYAQHLSDPDLITPTIIVYEVYKIIRRQVSEKAGLIAAGRLKAIQVIPLNDTLALEAADISLEHELPMADAIIYATAQAHGATLVTSDEHLDGLPGVVYLVKSSD